MVESTQRIRFRAMSFALLASGLLMGMKFGAYLLTGSTAILSDALESIINVVASGFALWSVYLSARPPDLRHPYGHGKIEYFSVGFEGALIILAAVTILYKSISAFFAELQLTHLDRGILLVLAAALVNLGLGVYLVRTGRRTRSLLLEADGRHLLTDVYTSAGVVVGLILVELTGILWLDPLVACLVAGNILFTGWRLMRESFGSLMDAADPEMIERIVGILNTHRKPEWIDIHQLRARRYGPEVHVDFHLILPRDFGLFEAHAHAKEIERLLLESVEEVSEVIVHLDPCEDPFCSQCRRYACDYRAYRDSGERQTWRPEEAAARKRHHPE